MRPNHHWSFALVTVAMVVLFGAACGSEDDDASGASETRVEGDDATDDPADTGGSGEDEGGGGGGNIDACRLLTDEEAGEVLGGAIVGSGPASGVGESVCAWEIEGDWSIVVSVGSPGTAPGNEFDPSSVMGGSSEEVATFEGAYYVGLRTVAFATAERVNTVQVVGPDGEDASRAAAEKLAALVHERIEEAAG
jgi:hypothetical protein